MKITFVLPHAGLTGGVRVIAIYAEALRERGHDVFVVSQPLGKPTARQRFRRWLRGVQPPSPSTRSHFDDRDVHHVVLDSLDPLMKRETYMDALHEFAGEYIKSGFMRGNPLAGKPDERFVMERALEAYMEKHNLLTLAREEDETWTIAHTNLVGEKLSKARDSYLRREGIATYIRRQSSSKEPFAVYYGAPRLPLIKRIRWAVGDSVLGPPWRAVKAFFSRPSKATP
jgi:hypothetical protein